LSPVTASSAADAPPHASTQEALLNVASIGDTAATTRAHLHDLSSMLCHHSSNLLKTSAYESLRSIPALDSFEVLEASEAGGLGGSGELPVDTPAPHAETLTDARPANFPQALDGMDREKLLSTPGLMTEAVLWRGALGRLVCLLSQGTTAEVREATVIISECIDKSEEVRRGGRPSSSVDDARHASVPPSSPPPAHRTRQNPPPPVVPFALRLAASSSHVSPRRCRRLRPA